MITTCLAIGASRNASSGYKRVHVLPTTILPQECDNNDGYTVFDVTEPAQPRYCFLVGRESEPYIEHLVEAMAPIDSRTYVSLYNRQDEDDETSQDDNIMEDAWLRPIFEDLDAYPLIESAALLSAWPDEKLAEQLDREDLPDIKAASPFGKSLRAKAMEEVILRALQSDAADLSWLDEAELLPDFMDHAFAHLLLNAEVVTRPAGLSLLCRALKNCQEVDLSQFSQLSPEQIFLILSELHGSSRHITLTLPSLNSLTAAEVRTLAQLPHIRDIRFGHTPGLELATLVDALSGTGVRTFSHPELYKFSLAASNQVPEDVPQGAIASTSKKLSEFAIVQAVYLGTKTRDDTKLPRCAFGVPDWAEHFSSVSADARDHYTGIGGFTIPYQDQFLPIPLHDIPLGTEELLPRLYRAIGTQIVGYEHLSGAMYWDVGNGLAMSLATDSKDRISPIPAELYCAYSAKGRNSVEPPPKVRPIVHGEWTLLICQEKAIGQGFKTRSSVVRHCLATRHAAGNLVVSTLEDFAKLAKLDVNATELAAELDPKIATPDGQQAVGHCQFEEAENIVKATDVYNSAIKKEYEGISGDMLVALRAEDRMRGV